MEDCLITVGLYGWEERKAIYSDHDMYEYINPQLDESKDTEDSEDNVEE